MKITEISPQKKNKGRSNLYLDGVFYCGLDDFTVLKNRLKAGDETEKATIDAIQEESELSSAVEKALDYISRCAKTDRQILQYLEKKGYTYPVRFKVLEKLHSYGYADDKEYARAFVETYSASRGKLRIKRDLIAKGISSKYAEAALENVGNQKDAAKKTAEKYMRGKTNDMKTRSKCFRYLMSKGFTGAVCAEITGELKDVESD